MDSKESLGPGWREAVFSVVAYALVIAAIVVLIWPD